MLERIANYLSFSLSALSVTAKVREADLVYVYATPATAGIPAQVWKRLFDIPYVLHVQDIWPESVTGSNMLGRGWTSRLAGLIMEPWLKKLYGNADALIAISKAMQRLLIERGNKEEKSSVVYNWADEGSIRSKTSDSFSGGKLQVLYAGNLGPMQDLNNVIEAAKILDNEPRFNLWIAGSGVIETALRRSARDLTRTKFLGRLPRSEVSDLYLDSHFQLVTLKDLPIFRTTIPSKLQASLAAGVPVITTVGGEVASLIRDYEAGLVAEPENADSLATAFRNALAMSAADRARMGRNARGLYEQLMSRSESTGAIVKIMEGISSSMPIDNTEEDR